MTPPQEPYSSFLARGGEGWHNGHDEEEDDEDEIIYDDDEDEFGLPSITTMRRKKTKAVAHLQAQRDDPYGGTGAKPSKLSVALGPGRVRANSADIAEERGAPTYPTARKGDGKILRPQYKEILKGDRRSDPTESSPLMTDP